MTSWFSSLKGAVTFSIAAMLSFIAYSLLVARYALVEVSPEMAAAATQTVIVVVSVGGWTWGLLAATGGKRGGLITMLVFSLLSGLTTFFDLASKSPIPYGWPLLQIVVDVTFALCVLASIITILQLVKWNKQSGK